MGAQAARLSVLRSAYAATSHPAPEVPRARVPGFARGPPGSTGFKARLGSIIRSGLGAAPAKPGPDWGRRRREGRESASGKEAGSGRLPLPALHSGRSGQLSLGSPYDLGETPLRDLPRARCTGSAHPRRSGALLWQESGRGTREERRAPGAGDPAARARLPFGEAGCTSSREEARGVSRVQRALSAGAGGGVDPRAGTPAWGHFPPGQERSLRGPGATTRGGGAPMPGPEAGYPCCLMFGCGSCFPALRPWAEAAEIPQAAPRSGHCSPSQQPADASPTPASLSARQTRRTPPLQPDSPA